MTYWNYLELFDDCTPVFGIIKDYNLVWELVC